MRKLGDASNFEKLFVVKLHNHSLLAPPQPLFTFEHPRAHPIELGYNERCATLRYRSAIGGLCHGFAGYFHCDLFGGTLKSERLAPPPAVGPPLARGAGAAAGVDATEASATASGEAIVISTEPSTRSAGMGSWFEAFLPLQVRHGDALSARPLRLQRQSRSQRRHWHLARPRATAARDGRRLPACLAAAPCALLPASSPAASRAFAACCHTFALYTTPARNALRQIPCDLPSRPVSPPAQHPIELRAGGEVVVTVWRRVDESARRVWYEWAVSEPIKSPVFNPNGRSYWIGL